MAILKEDRQAKIRLDVSSISPFEAKLLSDIMLKLPSDAAITSITEADIYSSNPKVCFIVVSDQFKEVQPLAAIPEINIVYAFRNGEMEVSHVDMSTALDPNANAVPNLPAPVSQSSLASAGVLRNPKCTCGTKMNSHSLYCPAHPLNGTNP